MDHRTDLTDTRTSSSTITTDVAVVGGGLAGLTAAAYAARGGARVVVIEPRSRLGGRARTTVDAGFCFNEGPHALYRTGAGRDALRGLGIHPDGGRPPLGTAVVSMGGRLRRVPPPAATASLLRLVRGLARDDGDPTWVGASAQQWIEDRIADPHGRALAAAFVRVTTYCGRLDLLSADAAIAQLRAGLRGVSYLHDGWGSLVAAIERVARDGGATVATGKATRLDRDGDHWVVSVGGAERDADLRVVARSVVMAAGGPGAAADLAGTDAPSLHAAASDAAPVHAACLDLGLARLTRRTTRSALGVDRPTYAVVHSAHARLADDGEVLHVMRYEPPNDFDAADLESIADELQPGWQDLARARQLGMRRVVAFDRPRPGAGLAGRPGPVVDDATGLFVAGDWVGPDDLLAGAALASGRAAGIAASTTTARPQLQRA